jgi:hypothetical protein
VWVKLWQTFQSLSVANTAQSINNVDVEPTSILLDDYCLFGPCLISPVCPKSRVLAHKVIGFFRGQTEDF